MHTHRDFAFNTEVYAKRTVGYREDDVTVSVPRLFFGYATGTNLLFPFAVGATVGLFSERPTAESDRRRDRALPADDRHERADDARQAARSRRRAPRAAASPASICRACASTSRPARRCPSRCCAGSSSASAADVYDGIGSAEMFHIYCSNRPGDIKPGSLGRVVEGYTLQDPRPRTPTAPGAPELPPGEIGVLWVQGRQRRARLLPGSRQELEDVPRPLVPHRRSVPRSTSAATSGSAGAPTICSRSAACSSRRSRSRTACSRTRRSSVAAVIAAEDEGLTKPKAFVVLRPDARDRIATPEGRARSPTSSRRTCRRG